MYCARVKSLRNVLSRAYPSVWIIALFVGITFALYSLLFNSVLSFDSIYFLNVSVERRANGEETQRKLVLLYTPFFGNKWLDYPNLGPLRPPMVEGASVFEGCEVSACSVTYNKSKILEADAVGFHGRDMPSSLPLQRTVQQIWFYFVLENPLNVNMDKSGYANIFNWTMSYRRESEIYTPYGRYSPLTKDSKSFTENDKVVKDKLVAWLVSNCDAEERQEYVSELQTYINVSIYGKCGDSESCPGERRSPICDALLRRHKFYLAFENGNCPDYVTEKYWENAIGNSIVPVVMGGADYKALAIPNSYIDVRDFESPKKLADYLLFLDANDTEYNTYFSWKKRYRRVAPRYACTLCKQLHNKSLYAFPKSYKNMAQFWSREQCIWLDLIG